MDTVKIKIDVTVNLKTPKILNLKSYPMVFLPQTIIELEMSI